MAEESEKRPIESWTESDVSTWLRSIKIDEKYIQKFQEEEVNGVVLLQATEKYLKNKIGMKSGPIHLLMTKRDELTNSSPATKPQDATAGKSENQSNQQEQCVLSGNGSKVKSKTKKNKASQRGLSAKRDCKPRPFGKEGVNFTYAKHNVLKPESGVVDMISPCHEYKSFEIAADLDNQRLQAKLAKETFKFACGCMNMRTNGTIHFGVMDSVSDSGYVHGEIIGIPIKDKDVYVDALDYMNKCFKSDSELAAECIRPPEFIEVSDIDSTEKYYVVEIDIEPKIIIVSSKLFSVHLPNFREDSNKVEYEKKTMYRRNGSKTEPISNQEEFYSSLRHRDELRKEAEKDHIVPDVSVDLGRKLAMLITDGKGKIEKEKWHIVVANRFQEEHLKCIDFLLDLKIFCVFDFDPDSKASGLCKKYIEHHAANLHFLQNYKIPDEMSIKDFEGELRLFEQVSWIFCNGRNDFRGNETPCDEIAWITNRKTFLKEAVCLICKQILPNGTFSVIFFLTSPVELPIVHTFHEFIAEMQGHDDIICISESEDNYSKWEGYAQWSCTAETVQSKSISGMKMSHVNATIQQLQPSKTRVAKHLSVFSKGVCQLEKIEEERMSSIEILSIDQCDDTITDSEDEIKVIEENFYRGGKVSWINFWLSEKKHVGEFIQRDTYKEISKRISDLPKCSIEQTAIQDLRIYHQPGSGGSTVARQVLWNNRKNFRCAVARHSFSASKVAEHAVRLREYEEVDAQKCLPVLLLVEDFDTEYLEDLRRELESAVRTQKIKPGTLCFLLLSCRQSHEPEKMSKESPLQNFSVTHKLSAEEKREFARKKTEVEKQYSANYIITFVLMSEEFNKDYIIKFVKDLLVGIKHGDVVTHLIHYVALLNTYVQNSYLSQSHCEALLLLSMQTNIEPTANKQTRKKHTDRCRRHLFESSLNKQAKVLFIHLRDEKTHIQSIRILHPLIAKEVLRQLLGKDQQQSDIAMKLLKDDVLFQNSFGKEHYHRFLRDLCMRRNKIIKGDKSDTSFSPLIEHILEKENPEKAFEILKAAYTRFNEDPFFAQQLARLCYTYEKFPEAKVWADIAEKKMPHNSYILDTKGQVFKRWFNDKYKNLDGNISPESTVDTIATALEAIECFRTCEGAANLEQDSMNNSGYFSEVQVERDLLDLVLKVFPRGEKGRSECMQYLVTGHIPERVKKPWECFHSKLKFIHKNMHDALTRISEDLSYFQMDVSLDDDEQYSTELKTRNPVKWLARQTAWYGNFFKDVELPSKEQNQLSTRMKLCSLGGDNITSIFSLLSEKKQDQLESIVTVYGGLKKLDQMELANYIASQIALGCVSSASTSSKLKELQACSHQFPRDRDRCHPNALFLLTLLFWPEDGDTNQERDNKYEILMSALDVLKRSFKIKQKNVPHKELRVFTHFYLGKGSGLSKIVHKSMIQAFKTFTVSQKRIKWFDGYIWKTPEIVHMLKRVQGWTEHGNVYIKGCKGKEIKIRALNSDSVPDGNENVEFYVGFTFQGPVACGITVCDAGET
ncbi:sterile alpha motif domain-containing protein 9-like [Brienomyrus brachyistius]|uniref:sterile alpha motif domain-containing protein 9-like n=1 Tax=Brienomyrus brachyistius TaxID=42636 RepID=UPI0020B24A9C|nr:sterile alpha motif domain-containing protein 9-like [Brienomyrus brachyistius]